MERGFHTPMLGSDTRAGRATTAGRRGLNHARGVAATAAALLFLAAAAPASAQFLSPEQPASVAAAGPNLTQRGIPAEATAENGVLAREREIGRASCRERV